MVLFSVFSIMDRQIIALLVEPIKHDLKLSDTELGLLQGLAFALMYSIAGLPLGWAVDNYPRRLIIYFGIMIWSIGAVSCGFARNFWGLFIGRSIVGIGEASVAPTAVSLIGDLFPPHRVGTALGVYAAGFPIGNGIALLVGGAIIGIFAGQPDVSVPMLGTIASWQAVFIVTGLPGLGIALFAFFLCEPPRPSGRANPAGALGQRSEISGFLAARGRVVACSFIAFALGTLVSMSIGGWTPAYLSRVFDLSPAAVGLRFGLVVGISGVLGNLLGGIAIDRVFRAGRHDACLIVPAVCTVISIPFIVGAYFMPTADAALMCLAIGLIPSGTTGAGSYATWQLIAPPHLRGRVTSAFVFVSSLCGIGVGPVAVGLTTDYVFRNEAMVGMSLALVLAITLPTIALFLGLGSKSLNAATNTQSVGVAPAPHNEAKI
jgi:MFS family permease